jgi:hypothetical protein
MLERNYVSRCHAASSHPTVQLLEELSTLVDNRGRGGKDKEVTPLGHLIQSANCPPAFNYIYESLFYEVRVSFDEGRQIKEPREHNEEFKKIFQEKKSTSKCFAKDGSKMKDKQFVGLTSIDIKDSRSIKFRIFMMAFTFTAEAPAIG